LPPVCRTVRAPADSLFVPLPFPFLAGESLNRTPNAGVVDRSAPLCAPDCFLYVFSSVAPPDSALIGGFDYSGCPIRVGFPGLPFPLARRACVRFCLGSQINTPSFVFHPFFCGPGSTPSEKSLRFLPCTAPVAASGGKVLVSFGGSASRPPPYPAFKLANGWPNLFHPPFRELFTNFSTWFFSFRLLDVFQFSRVFSEQPFSLPLALRLQNLQSFFQARFRYSRDPFLKNSSECERGFLLSPGLHVESSRDTAFCFPLRLRHFIFSFDLPRLCTSA